MCDDCTGSDCTWGVIFSGPRLFLSCPMDIAGSQVWFTDLWNYSVVPYIIEAVRDGLQVGLGPDPTEPAVVPFVCQMYGGEGRCLIFNTSGSIMVFTWGWGGGGGGGTKFIRAQGKGLIHCSGHASSFVFQEDC